MVGRITHVGRQADRHMHTPRCPSPNFQTYKFVTVPGRKDSEDVIKGKDLPDGRFAGVIHMGPI